MRELEREPLRGPGTGRMWDLLRDLPDLYMLANDLAVAWPRSGQPHDGHTAPPTTGRRRRAQEDHGDQADT